MCFVCASHYARNGEHPNHISLPESSQTDSGGLFSRNPTPTTPTTPTTSQWTQYIETVNSGLSWSASVGTSATVTYSFDLSAANDQLIYSDSPTAFNSAQQASAIAAMTGISQIANITFTQASSSATADIHFYVGDLNVGANVIGICGYMYSGTMLTSAVVGMDDSAAGFSTAGGFEYSTLLHEIGHAIGLKHPGNYSGSEDGPFLPSDLDKEDNTVMSYNEGATPATTMQPLDVAALQYIYGAVGSTTPTPTTPTADPETNDTVAGTSAAETLAGGLGDDTVSGDAGNDTIYGGRALGDPDDGSDVIKGGTGDDLIYSNADDDTVYGGDSSTSTGDGNDTIYGGLGLDVIYGNEGNDWLAGGGGMAHPTDDADSIFGGAGNDFIIGNGGGDTIDAGADVDTVYGGLGNDSIVGGDGIDTLAGQIGNDTLTGGTGNDIFAFVFEDGVDHITDFTQGEDVLHVIRNVNGSGIHTVADLVAAATVASGNTTIDLGSGNSIILDGFAGTLTTSDFLITV